MALLDFLKKKKEVEKSKKPVEKKTEKVSVVEKKEKQEKKAQVSSGEASKGFSYSIIKNPHISEKASVLGEKSQYIFKVFSDANKTEVKKSIEGIYNVNVKSVNIIKMPSKKRRLGMIEGFKKGYKKAIVTLKGGQKIEII